MSDRTDRAWVGWPLIAWGAVAGILLTIQRLASSSARGMPWGGRFFDGWNQFDGPEYLHIATQGYEQGQLVWFPLYPMLVRLVHTVVADVQLSAVAVSLAAGAALAVLLWRWLETTDLSPTARALGFAATLLYPYAWFLYGVIYADALYIALVLGTFVLMERDRTGPAVAAAALATAARPSGFALPLGLLVLHLDRTGVVAADGREDGWAAALALPTRFDRSRLRTSSLAPLAGFGGLAAYSAWQWLAWGSPVRWITEQANYHEPGPASLLKEQYFGAFSQGEDFRHLATTTFQAVILALVLVSVSAVGRRFGWGYGVFVLVTAAFPAISVSTFMGCGRYLLEAFPVLVLLGDRLSRRGLPARALWFALSSALLATMTFGFARSWYLT